MNVHQGLAYWCWVYTSRVGNPVSVAFYCRLLTALMPHKHVQSTFKLLRVATVSSSSWLDYLMNCYRLLRYVKKSSWESSFLKPVRWRQSIWLLLNALDWRFSLNWPALFKLVWFTGFDLRYSVNPAFFSSIHCDICSLKKQDLDSLSNEYWINNYSIYRYSHNWLRLLMSSFSILVPSIRAKASVFRLSFLQIFSCCFVILRFVGSAFDVYAWNLRENTSSQFLKWPWNIAKFDLSILW